MYSKGCGLTRVNEARHCLFTSGRKFLENIPPTQAAFFEHLERDLVQASFFWKQAASIHQIIPSFTAWGWQKEITGIWLPHWTAFEDASNIKHVPSCCTVAANGFIQETVNVAELESDAPGCANAKPGVSIMMILRQIPSTVTVHWEHS